MAVTETHDAPIPLHEQVMPPVLDHELVREYEWAERMVATGMLDRILPHFSAADEYRHTVLVAGENQDAFFHAGSSTLTIWEPLLKDTRDYL